VTLARIASLFLMKSTPFLRALSSQEL
jgi:hypothetical protein